MPRSHHTHSTLSRSWSAPLVSAWRTSPMFPPCSPALPLSRLHAGRRPQPRTQFSRRWRASSRQVGWHFKNTQKMKWHTEPCRNAAVLSYHVVFLKLSCLFKWYFQCQANSLLQLCYITWEKWSICFQASTKSVVRIWQAATFGQVSKPETPPRPSRDISCLWANKSCVCVTVCPFQFKWWVRRQTALCTHILNWLHYICTDTRPTHISARAGCAVAWSSWGTGVLQCN